LGNLLSWGGGVFCACISDIRKLTIDMTRRKVLWNLIYHHSALECSKNITAVR
jgi:hypothetical protein